MKIRWISFILVTALLGTSVTFAEDTQEVSKTADYISRSAELSETEQLRTTDDWNVGIADTEQAGSTYLDTVNSLQSAKELDNEGFIENKEQLLREDEQSGGTEEGSSGSGTTVKKTWWQKILELIEKLFPNRGKDEQGKTEASQQMKNATAQAASNYSFDKTLFTKFNTVTAPTVGNGANEPKFSYNRFLSEDISAYSGELTLNFEDLVLEGRNGLDLRIGRTYQSVASNVGDKVLMVLPDANGVLRNYLISARSTYLLDRYNLGMGWGFSFPSVQVETEYSPKQVVDTFYYDETTELYYHTGDGGVYKVEFTSDTTDSNLKGYYKKDIQFNRNDTAYSNGQVTSYYSMTLSDKTKQYFAKDGRLIGIVDRFGNTIKFEHTMNSITNRVPDGDFKSSNGLWTTSVSGTSEDAYTVTNKGRYDTSSMYFRRDNTSGNTYIMSKPIQVKPFTEYNFEVSIFSPNRTDVKVEFFEFDTLHQLQYTDTNWIQNTPENEWLDYSCTFSASSAGRYVVVKITPDDAKGMYIDRVHLDEPKPLLSKITDSIGRTVTFAYAGTIDSETKDAQGNTVFANGAVTLTVNAPGAEPRTLTYTKQAVGFSIEYAKTNQNETRLYWYLQKSETEGTDGTPVYYEYGGANSAAYEQLYHSYSHKTYSSSDEWVNKPILRTVRYRDRLKRYEYETVRKHMGDSGYYDTYRVKRTYDRYAISASDNRIGYTGALNTVNYSYAGTYNGNSYNNETGYPNYTFDEDTKLNEKWTQTKSGTATYKTTISNGAIVQQTASADGVTSTTDYTNHTTFKNSPTQIKNTTTQSGSTKETYQIFSYNNWGGIATESKEVDTATKNNASLLAKYTTTYQYHPTYHFITSQSYYNNIDEPQVTETYTYDSAGRLTDSENAVEEKTQYYYENSKYSGLLTKTVQDDPMNFHNLRGGDRVITYAYDSYGLYATTVSENYDGGTAQTSYQYDYMLGNVLSETKPDNSQTEYQYYSDGKIKYAISPYSQGVSGKVYYTFDQYSYFPMNVCEDYKTDETPCYTGVRKQSYQVFADDNSRLLQAASIQFYDAVGNLKYDMNFGFVNNDSTKGMLQEKKYYYDSYDRLEKVVDHVGNTTTYTYDGFSRPKSAADSEGNVYRYTYQDAQDTAELTLNNRRILTQKYDIYGNVKERIAYPSSTSTANSLSEKYNYDLNGNVTKYIDPKGQGTTYLYDAANRLTETVLPNGQKTRAVYSSFNEPSSEKIYAVDGTEKAGRIYYRNEKGDLTNKYYNFDGRLNITNSYQSDAKGRTIYTNEGENPKSILYDETDHPITTTSGSAKINRGYGYFGELIAHAPSSGGLVEYRYNPFGMCSVKWQNDYRMDYVYSYLNQILQSTMPSNREENYTYTPNGNLNTIVSENKTYTYDYYDTGLVKSITYPNGLKTAYVYDNINRITSITTTKGSSTINTLSYLYDANSNVTRETRNGQATNYTYDSLDRLVSVAYSNGLSVSYQYDALNNRTKETYSNGNVKTFVYDEQYRLKEIKMNNQTTDTYTYNASGAVLTHNDKTFTYDEWDKMVGYSDGSVEHSYSYDPNGIRTRKDSKDYIVDINNNVVAEANSSGTITDEILWGHQPLARKTGGTWYYYIYNAHGDVIGVVNESGTVVNNYTYDAWGGIVSQTEGISNPIKYAGEYYDDELGMYYLRARYYDPSIGRFTSKDPVESGMNRYAYCGNNPVNRIDPSGLFDEKTLLRMGANNADVATLQRTLSQWWGYKGKDGKPLVADGIWGENTEYAVRQFQKDAGLQVDGIVGAKTWSALGLSFASLPTYGEPNSKGVLYNPDGTVKQEREYGPDGRAQRDTDYNHPGENHTFPHQHEWDWSKPKPRQPGVPVDANAINAALGTAASALLMLIGAAALAL